MIVSYYCEHCDKTFSRKQIQSPAFTTDCECGHKATRTYKNITSTKEDENVSAAIETMKYSSLPSGKNKVNF